MSFQSVEHNRQKLVAKDVILYSHMYVEQVDTADGSVEPVDRKVAVSAHRKLHSIYEHNIFERNTSSA